MIKLCFFALFCVFLSVVLSEMNPKFKSVFSLGTGILFFLAFFQFLSPIADFFSSLLEKAKVYETFLPLIKGMGIASLVSLTASFCRDLGEDGVAGKLELCGKGAIFALSLPVLQSLFNLMEEILP